MVLVADSFGVLLMIKLSVGLDDVKDDAEKISKAIKSHIDPIPDSTSRSQRQGVRCTHSDAWCSDILL